jgi:hypothetical protein
MSPSRPDEINEKTRKRKKTGMLKLPTKKVVALYTSCCAHTVRV